MYQIFIKNIGTNRQFSNRFASQEAALAWHKTNIKTHGDENAIPPTAEVSIVNIDDQILAQKLKALLNNYTQVEVDNLSTVAAAKMLAWATAGNKKAKEVMAWSDALWTEYRAKQAVLTVGKPVADLTPSDAVSTKPYSFDVVQADVAANTPAPKTK